MNTVSDTPYFNDFTSWADVTREFHVDVPEPEEVLCADYEIDGYEGSAQVIYRHGDRVFEVVGGHCSCHGLENQWEPEEYDLATALAAFKKRPEYRHNAALKRAIARLSLLVHG